MKFQMIKKASKMKDLNDLINLWGKDLVKAERIQAIRLELMECRTNIEIDALKFKNQEFIDENPGLYLAIKNARVRIARTRKEAMKSWKLYEKN